MTIKQLEYFATLARTLNYSEAAKQLYVSQPALSRSIVLLEEEIGVKLLNRDKHNVSLTPAGALLAKKTAELGAELSRTIIETQQTASGSKGKLYLGVINGLPLAESIHEIIEEFRDSTEFELLPVVLNMEESVKAIHDNDIDLLYSYDFNAGIDEQLDYIEMYRDAFCMAVSTRSRYAHLESAHLRDFLREKLFVSGTESSFELHRWRETCASMGFMPNFTNVLNPATQIFCVEQNMGVTILPSKHQAFELDGIHRVALIDDFTLSATLKWNRTNYNPCIPVFLELLKRHDRGKT